MIETITIARPYAKAAFGAAKDTDSVESWAQFFETLSELMSSSDVQNLLINPQMNNDRMLAFFDGILAEILKNGYTEAQRNFLVLLADNGRFQVISDICDQFMAYRDEFLGVKNAQITTALALDDASVASLIKSLEQHYECKIRANVIVDASLIGGVRIAVGDQVIDASVREKLDCMAAALTQ